MKASTPHFLLFSESSRKDLHGRWRFVLQSIDGSEQFEAADAEPEAKGERLELLAVVRGLEALPGPSHVTLVTPSKYVNRGLAYGLKEWRANGWQWEHFGEMVPIKNRDLWQRVDRALNFHRLECRAWRFDLPHVTDDRQAKAARLAPAGDRSALDRRRTHSFWSRSVVRRLRRRSMAMGRWSGEKMENVRLRLAQFGTQLLPLPWLE